MAATREEVISYIENMTVLELSEFIKTLEEKFGVQAAMPMMAAERRGLRPRRPRSRWKSRRSST